MTAVIARILARWIAGALIGYGLVGAETGAQLAVDPDVALLLAGIVGAVTEGAYVLAKRKGWAT